MNTFTYADLEYAQKHLEAGTGQLLDDGVTEMFINDEAFCWVVWHDADRSASWDRLSERDVFEMGLPTPASYVHPFRFDVVLYNDVEGAVTVATRSTKEAAIEHAQSLQGTSANLRDFPNVVWGSAEVRYEDTDHTVWEG